MFDVVLHSRAITGLVQLNLNQKYNFIVDSKTHQVPGQELRGRNIFVGRQFLLEFLT
jgi:hypothetical protein